MKTKILIISILFANISAFSQSIMLLDPTNMWSILEEYDCAFPGMPNCTPYKHSHWIKTGNDTVLNGKTYTVMLYSTDENHSTWGSSDLFLREENEKVYWCNEMDIREKETLLYDFGLQEGESISRYDYPNSILDTTKIISTVDSIRYIQLGNTLCKIFYISNTSTKYDGCKKSEIWIEGIGSSWGMKRDNSMCCDCVGYPVIKSLLCFYQNEEKIYHSPNFDDCYYNWTWGKSNGIEETDSTSTFQQYQPIFGNETTQWVITNRGVIPEAVWMDTILTRTMEAEYKILEYKGKWSGDMGKIRTNETNSKLYLIKPGSASELLIMDLDLSVGDAFNIKMEYDVNRTIYVDSVYMLDGKKHIQFNQTIGTSTPPGEIKRMFIEGVGPNWGFSEDPYLIVCKYNDFDQIYSFENEYIKDCNFLQDIGNSIDINDHVTKNEIKIHPNPVLEYVVINIPEMSPENVHLTVYNTSGMRILSRTLTDFETVLDLSHFPNGFYYFNLQTPNTTIVKKMVKSQK